MKYIIDIRSIWEIGKRDNQEDSLFPAHNEAQKSDRLFIICDGMGGHASGEVASSTVCEAMSQYIMEHCPDPEGDFSDDDLRQAITAAFDALDGKDSNESGRKKMGTTMTVLKLHNKGCTIAHIGDSRIYHVRPGETKDDTRILFQSVDHSLVNDLIKVGELTPEEAKTSNVRNVITRALQPHMEYRPKADIYHTHDIKPGDYFMLCSDGVLEQFEDEHIQYYFSNEGGDIDGKVEKIISDTEENRDNHTAFLIRIEEVIDPLPVAANEDTPVERDENTRPDFVPNVAPDNEDIRKTSSTPSPDNRNKQIAIATAIIILLILVFVTFHTCSKKTDNSEMPKTPVETTETINDARQEIEKSHKEIEEAKREAEQAKKANEEIDKERKELKERLKQMEDSIKAANEAAQKKAELRDSIQNALLNTVRAQAQNDSAKNDVQTMTQTFVESLSADNGDVSSDTESNVSDPIQPTEEGQQ